MKLKFLFFNFYFVKRSRRFMTLVLIIFLLIILIIFKLSPRSRKISSYTTIELENCIQSKIEKYSDGISQMNIVVSEWAENVLKNPDSTKKNSDLNPSAAAAAAAASAAADQANEEISSDVDEKLFLPYTGNGYIGQSLLGRQGIFANFQKSLSLQLNYNPLAYISSDVLPKREMTIVQFNSGLVHKYQCYQNHKECLTVQNTLYAHRTRPSVLIEEITFNNPSKESVTFDIIQIGSVSWNHSKTRVESINGADFTISNGIIDVIIDSKQKHLCISIASTRLPVTILVKEHDFNQKYNVLTVVKYSSTFLTGKLDTLDSILIGLEAKVIEETKEILAIGFNKLKKEHTDAWNNIWKSGFGISNSLATGAINGDQINGSIYYVLTNNRAPLIEMNKPVTNLTETKLQFHMERCYEGFSTLHALKLWKLPRTELEVSSLNSIWSLTLQKHGCKTLLDLGVDGMLQAILLSIGGLKFTLHHLDLNLNPRQIHRDYSFRRINYANQSLITIDVQVGSDNHALLYVTLNELFDTSQKFYACDAGCIDPPVRLELDKKLEFPVKLTNPITAILYISHDNVHIGELKHALHVQEIDIAPPQDVNSIAIHKHGHHMAGLATLFWTLFVILIIIFHLFLIKLVYRELCSANSLDKNGYSSSYESNKKYRYSRTV